MSLVPEVPEAKSRARYIWFYLHLIFNISISPGIGVKSQLLKSIHSFKDKEPKEFKNHENRKDWSRYRAERPDRKFVGTFYKRFAKLSEVIRETEEDHPETD